MNKKLIAVAVASAVAVPVVSAADVTVYGRVNNALQIYDTGGNSTTNISNIASRFGIKASSDVGNGLTASAQYEFSATSDKEEPGVGDARIGKVSLSGGFGSVAIGQQWSAFYDTVGTDIDPSYWVGSHLYQGGYRTSNTIKYANSFGPVYLEADVRINDDDTNKVAESLNGDGYGFGVRIAASDYITLAAAIDKEREDDGSDTDRIGVSSKLTAGNFFAMLGYNEKEEEASNNETAQVQMWLGTSVGATTMMLGYGQIDKGGAHRGDNEPTAITFGVYHNLGAGLRLYYEGTSVDKDMPDSNADITDHLFGIRYDF